MGGGVRGAAWLGAASMLVSAGPALAQLDKPKRRPPPTAAPAQAEPAKPDPALRPGPPPLVLRSAVQSRWSRAPVIARSTAGQCRAGCAGQRITCQQGALAGGGDSLYCDSSWTQCLTGCDGLAYSRGP